jgi:hypothetical protein
MPDMVRPVTALLAALPVAIGLAGGCAVGGAEPDRCRAAADHVAACLGTTAGAASSSCDATTAQTVLALSCEDLVAGGGKADGLADIRALLCRLGDATYCTACGDDATGLWVWDSSVVLDIGVRQRLFDFARGHGVGALYVNVEGLVATRPEAVAAFVIAAAAQCLETELLFGAPDWALEANHHVPLDLAQQAVRLGAAALHFDVEPYTLAEWSADPQRVSNQYLDLLEALAAVTQGAPMRLTVDAPFWFDGELVTRDGATRPLSEWIADLADRVVLMDYRDQVDGSDGIVAHAATEIAYAGAIGREVVVGVETACGELPKTTFCEEGPAALESAIEATTAALSSEPGFAGVAVHHYAAYQAL